MKNNKEKTGNKIEKRKILTRIMAGVLLTAMVLASCSTVIYYIVDAI